MKRNDEKKAKRISYRESPAAERRRINFVKYISERCEERELAVPE